MYNPIMEEMFTAVRGKGAFLNGDPIHASSCSSLGSALAITEIGVTRDDGTLDALFGRIRALTKQACSATLSLTLATYCSSMADAEVLSALRVALMNMYCSRWYTFSFPLSAQYTCCMGT